LNNNIPLAEILSNPDALQTVKVGYELLQIINEKMKLNEHINPKRLADLLHSDKLSKLYNDEKLFKNKLKNKAQVIGKKCRNLVELGLIEKQTVVNKKDSKVKYYILTENGKQLLNEYSNSSIEDMLKQLKQKKPSKPFKNQPSYYHYNKIRDLLKRIIDDFPDVYEYFVSEDSFDGFQNIYIGGDFSFESDVLFQDLENHLGTSILFKELQDQIIEFKQKATELRELHKKSKEIIRVEIQNKLKLNYDEYCQMENTFSKDLVDWVYKAINQHIELENINRYRDLFVDKNFDLEISNDIVIVRSEVDLIMKLSETEHIQTVSNLKELMIHIDSMDSYEYIKIFVDHRTDLERIRKEIIEKLSHEIELTKIPGDCVYL
jgi:predicted transcriptional regulator